MLTRSIYRAYLRLSMKIALKPVSIMIALIIITVGKTFAHGPIHEKIEKVSKQIAKNPNNPSLYIERAGYYKIDADFDRSHADYLKAQGLDPNLTTVHFLLAELYLFFGHEHSALHSIRSFEKEGINRFECLNLKAKIFDQLFKPDSALYYGSLAYSHMVKPRTHYFRTMKQYALNSNPDDKETPTYWLLEGLKKIPKDLVLSEELVDLYADQSEYQKAEDLCKRVLQSLKRKEYWHLKLAIIYNASGKRNKAVESLKDARDAISKLSNAHKNTSYIKRLTKEIDELNL